MHLRFGSSIFVGSSVDMAKFFLRTHDVLFLDRPRTASGKHTTYNYADITWSPYGAYWRQARRICATELFSARRLASFEYIRNDKVRALVRGLFAASASGAAVHLNRDHLSTLSMNVITRMVLGKRFFGVFSEHGELLLRKPAVFAKATKELDRVVGHGRWPTEKDMPQLPYLDAIVKETTRLHPIAPLLTPRIAREDAAVGGYDVPKGARVLVNVWAIGRDPALWDAPERFLGRKMDVKGQDFELPPFGSGRRMCPGYGLGLKEIQLSLANLLHGFSWSLPEGMAKEDLSMGEVLGLSTTRRSPLEVVVHPGSLPNSTPGDPYGLVSRS
ncbi:cytochrome P450 71A1-like isoform X2 [Panicum miliaceum]|uniref:Cytochrome P450 71A1-like isoform X2 n=1 Tax=Panicum miliaceum TaxID=4540 RepID=A0A3L6PVB9_PANMI|nr:cytochrome P450 71A1-like isoform X2 [Panicum miliaceum]